MQQFDGIHILRNAQCHLFGRFHGEHHRLRAVDNVASGKYAAARGHAHRAFAHDDISLFIDLNALR